MSYNHLVELATQHFPFDETQNNFMHNNEVPTEDSTLFENSDNNSPNIAVMELATKADVQVLKQHIDKRINYLEAKLKGEISQMKLEFKQELNQFEDGLKNSLTRILQKVESQNNTAQISKSVMEEGPLKSIVDVSLFERKIQQKEEIFLQLIAEFKKQSQHNADKFVRACWRKVLTDEAAQDMCWKGTDEKMAVRPMTITLAIKHAFKDNFPALDDSIFERCSMQHFQYAKTRVKRKSDGKENEAGPSKFNKTI